MNSPGRKSIPVGGNRNIKFNDYTTAYRQLLEKGYSPSQIYSEVNNDLMMNEHGASSNFKQESNREFAKRYKFET